MVHTTADDSGVPALMYVFSLRRANGGAPGLGWGEDLGTRLAEIGGTLVPTLASAPTQGEGTAGVLS